MIYKKTCQCTAIMAFPGGIYFHTQFLVLSVSMLLPSKHIVSNSQIFSLITNLRVTPFHRNFCLISNYLQNPPQIWNHSIDLRITLIDKLNKYWTEVNLVHTISNI